MRSERLTAERRRLLDRLLDEQAGPSRLPRISPATVDRGRLPLSFAQQRLWFIDRLDPGSALYNMISVARLSGALDRAVLGRCLDEVVRRHETLRTTFHEDDGEPWARVEPARPVEPPYVDLTGLPPGERDAALADRCRAEAHRPFDLARDLMMRAVLVRMAPGEHRLVLCLHHIAADGWSLEVMLRELVALYGAFAEGRPSPLPELDLQYADFTVWQREHLSGTVLRSQLDYWRERLTGAPTAELPADRSRSATRSSAGASVPVELSPELVGRLRALGDLERATQYMVLLTGFAVVLARWSGQADLVVGSSIAGRNRAEIAGLIGFFANTLPLRLDLSGRPSFRELLGRVREVCLAGYAHQDAPFERIVEELNPDRDQAAHTPLFRQTLVVYETPNPTLRLPGLDVEIEPFYTDTAKFDLRLEFTPRSSGALSGIAEYPAELHDESTMRRFVESLRLLLTDAAAEPDLPVDRLRLIDQAEHDRLVGVASGAGVAPAGDCRLHELFERSADRWPDAVAVTDGTTRLTYRELDERANRLARHLRASGVGPEETVGVCLPHSAETVAVLLGVLKAGAAYVPLDPAYPAARLELMIEDCGARTVVTRPGLLPDGAHADVMLLDEEEARIADLPATRLTTYADPRTAAYVIYTSGSTGRPKGTIVEHRAVVNRVHAMLDAYRLGPDEAVLHKTPLGFDVATGEWAMGLAAGARVVIAEPGGHRDPAHLVALITAERVGTANFVPSLLRVFLDEPGVAGCTSLRRVLCGGERLTPGLVRRFREVLPDAGLYNLYGPTETAIDVTAWPMPADGPPAGIARIPIGAPIPGTRLHVLDENLRPVPVGMPGELYVGGVQVGRGYHARPGLTAERFVPDPFGDGGRLYRTGDAVRRLPDGTLDYLGRLDRQLKVRGQRIEPGEIEAAVASHPLVDRAVVTTHADPAGDVRIAAYVTMRETDPTPDLRREHCDHWRSVFEETYTTGAPGDPAADLTGWNSVHDGRPIPEEQMRAFVDETVRRILSLRPSRVLEIGCGTGLLLSRIAPRCETYCGTDVSAAALAAVRARQDGAGGPRLLERHADDLSGLVPGDFDTVILNSVVQYFPDVDFLTSLLERVAPLLRPGGRIFLGDVRGLPLLETLWTSVLARRLGGDTTTPSLRRMAARQVAHEEELVLDPALFPALVNRIPEITSAVVAARAMPDPVELTAYRYDVVLRVGDAPEPPAAFEEWDWARDGERLAGRLGAGGGTPLVVRGIPDARLREDVRTTELTRAEDGPATLAELRRRAAEAAAGAPAAVRPGELVDLAARHDHTVVLTPARAGTLDAIFTPSGARPFAPPPRAGDDRPWPAYANTPLRATAARLLVPALRAHAQERLPEAMVPAGFVVLPEWPIGPNGKLDVSALPPPDEQAAGAGTAYVAPRTRTERVVADIWRDMLPVERVGVHDDFFDLGGHSLLAARLVARIRAGFGVNLPLGVLLRTPTVAEVAAHLDRTGADERSVAPINRAERRRRERP